MDQAASIPIHRSSRSEILGLLVTAARHSDQSMRAPVEEKMNSIFFALERLSDAMSLAGSAEHEELRVGIYGIIGYNNLQIADIALQFGYVETALRAYMGAAKTYGDGIAQARKLGHETVTEEFGARLAYALTRIDKMWQGEYEYIDPDDHYPSAVLISPELRECARTDIAKLRPELEAIRHSRPTRT